MNDRAVRRGESEHPTPLSSEATPNARVVAQGEKPVKCPPRVEGMPIDLSSESDTNLPRAEGEVAESGPVVEQGVEVEDEADPATKNVPAAEGAEPNSPVDRASKRPRVNAEASGSKSPLRIIIDPSERLQEKARSFLKEMKKSLNCMLNLIRERTEESVTVAWRKLEEDRNHLREVQQKILQDLQISQSQVASQAAMLKNAHDEINVL